MRSKLSSKQECLLLVSANATPNWRTICAKQMIDYAVTPPTCQSWTPWTVCNDNVGMISDVKQMQSVLKTWNCTVCTAGACKSRSVAYEVTGFNSDLLVVSIVQTNKTIVLMVLHTFCLF